VKDTLVAGAGMSHPRAVELCVREAPERIRMLQSHGAHFDLAQGAAHADESSPSLTTASASAGSASPELDLHLEGGHSARRIVHTGDMTGREVERALVLAVSSAKNIRVLDEHMAIDLITLAKYGGPEVCAGAYVFDVDEGKVETVLARATVLASGGAGKANCQRTAFANMSLPRACICAAISRSNAQVLKIISWQGRPSRSKTSRIGCSSR
jgi:L-aspartate oxidase